jgi:hypothetical protein
MELTRKSDCRTVDNVAATAFWWRTIRSLARPIGSRMRLPGRYEQRRFGLFRASQGMQTKPTTAPSQCPVRLALGSSRGCPPLSLFCCLQQMAARMPDDAMRASCCGTRGRRRSAISGDPGDARCSPMPIVLCRSFDQTAHCVLLRRFDNKMGAA